MERAVSCVNADDRPKAVYVSEAAARRALKHSARWHLGHRREES